MKRVIMVDGDNASLRHTKALITQQDEVFVAGNNPSALSEWQGFLSTRAQGSVECADSTVKQSADMLLSFVAGEKLAKRPSLAQAPWILISRDKDFFALSACLASRGVETISHVHMYAYTPKKRPLPATAKPPATAKTLNAKPKSTALAPNAKRLNKLINKAGGYPFNLANIRGLLRESPGDTNKDATLQSLRDTSGGVKKQVLGMGFRCSGTHITHPPHK